MDFVPDGDQLAEDDAAVDCGEGGKVEAWRLHTLLEAGYPTMYADQLAGRTDVDLHQAVELVEQGCPPATAVRILA
jgi:hypothetical protein